MKGEVVARITLIALVTLLAIACDDHNADSGQVSTSTWPSSPSVPPPPVNYRWVNPRGELMTPDATFIRAFMESRDAMTLTAKMGAGFPGFGRAAAGTLNPNDYRPSAPTRNTEYFGIATISSRHDSRVIALVCDINATERALPWILEYYHTGAAPPNDQAGTANRPTGNVFGGWQAVHFASSREESKWDACAKLRPATLPTAGSPAEPPSPGWPG